jgi:NarL family two-component system response regulator LiaR
MSAPQRIRILCVDDHPEIRRLFELVMRDHEEFELVGTSQSADELETLVQELTPDVVVLDISMDGRDPLEALKAVRIRVPDVRFLVCSSWDDEEIIQRALAAGATGDLVKDGVFDELTRAIRTVAKNEKVVPRRPSGRP